MGTHVEMSLLRAKLMRITKLDACGRPFPAGTEDCMITTKGFTEIGISSEIEDGDEITTKRADGSICLSDKAANSFKYLTAEIHFCGVNPNLLALMTNVEKYLDYAGNASGITVASGEVTKAYALEFWMGVSGMSCDEGADEASGYVVFPFMKAGSFGDFTVNGTDGIDFSMTGSNSATGNSWGRGPYNSVYNASQQPSVLPTPLEPNVHMLLLASGLAVPEVTDGVVPMPPSPVIPANRSGEKSA